MTTAWNEKSPADAFRASRDVTAALSKLMESRHLGQSEAFRLLCDTVFGSGRTMWEVAADYLVTGEL